MGFIQRLRYVLGIVLVFVVTVSIAAETATPDTSIQEKALPEVLDFKTAMQLVDEGAYIESLLAKADYKSAQSTRLAADGINDFQIELIALAQYIDPSVVVGEEINDDHRLSLVLKKNLLDFGFSEEKTRAADSRIKAAELTLQQIRLVKRIEVADKFLRIKLSDLLFSLDNESIASAFIAYDKTRERNELKMVSDVELLEAEFEYQKVRARRYQSETEQRISRARFAESISRPDDLPAEVVVPDFSSLNIKRPEYEELLKIALANNFKLRAQQLLVEAASHELKASRNKNSSNLSTELEWTEYSQETPTKNNWRATLKYSLPLYENDADKAETARALAEWQKQKLKLRQIEAEIRQQLLEAWQQIYILKARQDIDVVAEEFRELYQDRSRAYYEMEYRTDLGDSFIRVTEARVEKFKNNSALMLAWMEIAAITGVTLEEFLKQ